MAINLADVGSGYKRTAINNNFQSIEDEINNNLLSKNGGIGLEADLDANSQKIINLDDGVANSDAVNLGQVNGIINAAGSGLIVSQKEVLLGSDAVSRVFTFTGITYVPSGNNLAVYRNGQRLETIIDYLESGTTQVTLTFDPNASDRFVFITNESTDTATTAPQTVNVLYERQVATAGQTAFTLTNSYVVGTNGITVYVNGILQTIAEYVETSNSIITFNTSLTAGDNVDFYVGQALISTPTSTSNVTHTESGTDYTLSTYLQNRHVVNVKDFGAVGDGATDDTSDLDAAVYRFGLTAHDVYIPEGAYRSSTFRTNNINIKAHPDAQIDLFNSGATPVMGQLGSNSRIEGLTFNSTETDLNNQRVSCEGATNVSLERCTFQGFRDEVLPTDAWGLYLKNTSDVQVVQCGFDSNSQSDLVFVGSVKNVSVDGCYGTGSTFHVNFEPNNVAGDYVENVTLKNMHMTQLSILEPGSGRTLNRGINISGCEIDHFIYDGGQVTLQDCQVGSWDVETQPFFGELRLKNTVALGPNLLEDPYMVNIAFTSGQATTDSNAWYMNSRTGSITGGNEVAELEEDGIRFMRINPNGLSGTINFTTANTISALPGEHYVIAITGRRHGGTAGPFFSIFDGSIDRECYAFRQADLGTNYWTTELLVLPVSVAVNLAPKVGTWLTGTNSVDIKCITMHKILDTGGGDETVLNQYHGNLQGVRELLPVATLPTFSSANLRGVIAGDRISLTSTGAPYYWNGTSWTAM